MTSANGKHFLGSICEDGTVGTVGTGRERRLFKSMACSYVIAAAGPAQPDVRAEPFNGATCMWERNEGVGENYQALTKPLPSRKSASDFRALGVESH